MKYFNDRDEESDNRYATATIYIWLAIICLIVLIVGLWSLKCDGADVNLGWDAPRQPYSTNVITYAIYGSTNPITASNRTNSIIRLNAGTNTSVTVTNLTPGIWYFAATSVDGLVESDLSAVLTVGIPEPPAKMRTVIIQYGGTLTNFTDVGFFRLKIQ